MITRRRFISKISLAALAAAIFTGGGPWMKKALAQAKAGTERVFSVVKGGYVPMEKIERLKEEWKKILTPQQFNVLREKGTERPFTGAFWDSKRRGIYRCAGCELDLFSSEHKFDSGTGWPSFWQPVAPENVETEEDRSLFSLRTEVHCPRCGGHLGHVFNDGPKPTGLRYCINSVSLTFAPVEE